MAKPRYVYHGSGKELIGDILIPKKANDLNRNPENMLNGVYASGLKKQAIAMGILSCKGVIRSSCGEDGPRTITAIVYEGWPEQEHFYLYTLPSTTFENMPRGSHQYVSLVPVKPLKIEKLLVKDYIHLVRRATDEEKKNYWAELDRKA